MLVFHRLLTPPFGVIGVSVVGASLHNIGQLLVLSSLFVSGYRVMNLAPVLVLMSVPVGILVGVIGSMLLRAARLAERGESKTRVIRPGVSEMDAALQKTKGQGPY
jgi:uncharacterized membrane protein